MTRPTVRVLLVCCLLALTGCVRAGAGLDPAATDRQASRAATSAGPRAGGAHRDETVATTTSDGTGGHSPSTAGGDQPAGDGVQAAVMAADDSAAWESGRIVPVTVHFVHEHGGRLYLVPERRPAAAGAAPAAAARLALTERPIWPGPVNPFPDGTRLLAFDLDGGTATVDVSSQVLAWKGSAEKARYSVQALTRTLASTGEVERVRVRVEGREDGVLAGHDIARLWGGLAVTGPATIDPSVRLAPITLSHPRPNTAIAGDRLLVRGEASTSQGTVSLRLRDPDGEVVAQSFTTADSRAPGRGAFSESLTFTPPPAKATWTLEVFEASPADGSITYQVTVPVLVGA